MIITMSPGSISEDVLIGTGDKGGLVLSGRVVLTVGESTTELGEGDSFQFKSNVPHGIANRSAEEAKLIWIMSVLDTHLYAGRSPNVAPRHPHPRAMQHCRPPPMSS